MSDDSNNLSAAAGKSPSSQRSIYVSSIIKPRTIKHVNVSFQFRSLISTHRNDKKVRATEVVMPTVAFGHGQGLAMETEDEISDSSF